MNASSAQQKFRRAILEADAEISHEFSEHYWKDVLQNDQNAADQSSSSAESNEAITKGFLFYLNASGRYLILREHLRSALCNIVHQKYLNLRPSGFHNHRDFQSFLHDMYVYLVDEMHDVLSSVTLQETDPLKSNLDRLLQQTNCAPEDELSKVSLHNRQITDLGIFAEESFAQGDFETCHKLHLQRICRDKESSRCWTEFAIMWLSRGDDRMAEISVREALRKDPLHVFALLISGMISVRHGDERGLECLGAALGIFPMSPEILVIVGIANSLIGNDIAADYFFRKATYVHRTITGQPTHDIEKLFTVNNARKPFNMRQFSRDMDAGVPYLQEPPSSKKHVQVETQQLEEREHEPFKGKRSINNRRSKHSPRQSQSQTQPRVDGAADKKQNTVSPTVKQSVVDEEGLGKKQSKTKKGSTDLTYNNSKTNATSTGSPESRQESINESMPSLSSAPSGPKFPFLETLSDILQEEVNLPLLAPSIQSPYNVCMYTRKMEEHLMTIDFLEKSQAKVSPSVHKQTQEEMSRSKSKGDPTNVYIPKDDGVASDNQIKAEYDKIISNTEGDGSSKSGFTSVSASTRKVGTNSGTQVSTSSKSKKSGKLSAKDKVNKVAEVPQSSVPSETVTSISPAVINADSKISANQVPKLTDRLGTELIWTAHLLVNLRLFDVSNLNCPFLMTSLSSYYLWRFSI